MLSTAAQRLHLQRKNCRCKDDRFDGGGGLTHSDIARSLSRSAATARSHLRTIYGKLDVGHVAGLMQAMQAGEE